MNRKKIIIIACGVIAVFGLVFATIKLTGSSSVSNGGVIKTDKGNVKIVKNEASQIALEGYNDSNGNFKMKIPKGWKVETLGDYIHFTIRVYNPENPTYQFFFNLKTDKTKNISNRILNKKMLKNGNKNFIRMICLLKQLL